MQNTQQDNTEARGALERRIDMTVAVADIETEIGNRLKRMAKTVKMPGFRPGKVPLKMVEQTYGMQVRSEAMGSAVEKAFVEKVREQNLRIAGTPQIEPKESDTDGTLAFSAVFEVYPEVTLNDLSGQSIERAQLDVGEEEVNKTIDVLRKQRTSFEEVDRAAQEGDRVNVNFLGKKDDEPFDGGQANDFPFVIGAGAMLKDFEQAALGLSAGDSKSFDMTFPEDYHATHLAGQPVSFEITINRVDAPRLPEVDEDFARALGVADGNVDQFRSEVKANLEREVKHRLQSRLKEQVMDVLLASHPIEVPKALIEDEAKQLAENAKRDFEMRGMRNKDLKIEADWFTEQAERRVRLGLIMAELVKQKELFAKPDQVKALVEEMAQSYEDPSEMVRWYYSQPERLQQAEAVVVENNVVEWVADQVNSTTSNIAFDELMGPQAQ